MLPNLEDISPKFRGSKIFSKFDAACGFHQIPLHEESRLLAFFMTAFRRFCFKRLPSRIFSAPEIFQHRMTELLGDIEGVQVIIKDVLIHGRTMEEHNKRPEETLKLIESGIKLNPGKCEVRKSTIRYFRHIISDKEIQPSKDKIEEILKLPPPSAIPELILVWLVWFYGISNFVGYLTPNPFLCKLSVI